MKNRLMTISRSIKKVKFLINSLFDYIYIELASLKESIQLLKEDLEVRIDEKFKGMTQNLFQYLKINKMKESIMQAVDKKLETDLQRKLWYP